MVVAVGPAVAGEEVRLADEVPLGVVAVAPGAVGQQAVARPDHVSAAHSVAVGVVAEPVGHQQRRFAGQLPITVVGVVGLAGEVRTDLRQQAVIIELIQELV